MVVLKQRETRTKKMDETRRVFNDLSAKALNAQSAWWRDPGTLPHMIPHLMEDVDSLAYIAARRALAIAATRQELPQALQDAYPTYL